MALSLLKHMTHRSPYVRGVLLREGVMGAVRGLWGQGFTAYGGSLGVSRATGWSRRGWWEPVRMWVRVVEEEPVGG